MTVKISTQERRAAMKPSHGNCRRAPEILPTRNCEQVADWIKLTAFSLLISTLLTVVLGAATFAVWWELMR
jgi:hypothetical protein